MKNYQTSEIKNLLGTAKTALIAVPQLNIDSIGSALALALLLKKSNIDLNHFEFTASPKKKKPPEGGLGTHAKKLPSAGTRHKAGWSSGASPRLNICGNSSNRRQRSQSNGHGHAQVRG